MTKAKHAEPTASPERLVADVYKSIMSKRSKVSDDPELTFMPRINKQRERSPEEIKERKKAQA